MALAAIFLHRCMHLFQVKGITPVGMALKTDLAVGGVRDEKFLGVRGMSIVAGDTVPDTDRAMLIFPGENGLVVAVETERTDGLAFFPL